jgi:hypothetical protein
MSQPQNTDVERGASEDAAGSPLTETEIASSERPPSEPGNALPDDSDSADDSAR